MTNQLLLAILLSFAAGASITWLIFKNRVAITMADLKSKWQQAEEKLKDSNNKLAAETAEKNSLQDKNLSLDKENTKLNTERIGLQNALIISSSELKDANSKIEKLQADHAIALQQKAAAERDLANAIKTINDALESE